MGNDFYKKLGVVFDRLRRLLHSRTDRRESRGLLADDRPEPRL